MYRLASSDYCFYIGFVHCMLVNWHRLLYSGTLTAFIILLTNHDNFIDGIRPQPRDCVYALVDFVPGEVLLFLNEIQK